MVAAQLARQCCITMSVCRAQKFSSRHHTFLTKRFDRTDRLAGGDQKRIHFASAMTLLGYTDGASHAEGASYLELVEWIIRNCDDADRNLEQLWRRIVFNISDNDNSLDFDLAMSVAKYFGLSTERASAILKEVQTVVSGWQKVATHCGIPRSEQEIVARAFKYK